MSVAVCDPEAFYPLRNLVAGPATDLRTLSEVERFVRAVVLHDEISMELEPWPHHPDSEHEFSEEEKRAGKRSVIVAMGPVLTGYDFFSNRLGVTGPSTSETTLSPALNDVARRYSNAEEGNVYYQAHIDYLNRIIKTVQGGGSALLAGEFGSAAIGASTAFPAVLFEALDRDWQQFAREADAGDLGFMVPPVLSIVLTRCRSRESIPTVINDLRAEWADARAKVWALVNQLRSVRTVAEARRIRQELAEASRLISPTYKEVDTRPIRVLWDLVAGGLTGAATALISGGLPGIGATVGGLVTASRTIPSLIHEFGSALFGRGAFDLARRVRREALRVEYDALARLLTDAEKQKLRL